jgi:hypothetical protein
MELDRAASLLNVGLPVEELPVTDLLASLDKIASVPSSAMSTLIMVYPKSYLNRKSERVDICGAVEIGTKEYDRGWRFFCSEGSFYHGDGRRFENHDSPEDLIEEMVSGDDGFADSPIFHRRWVHAKHRVLKSFFQRLYPGKFELVVGGWYLNRKGFVVHLVSRQISDNKNVSFCDDNRMSYDVDGSTTDTSSSMHDLVYEIKNQELFDTGDWSSERFPHNRQSEADDGFPEMFDPNGSHREAMMKQLFEHTLKAHSIAKELGIDYGFHMGDGKS